MTRKNKAIFRDCVALFVLFFLLALLFPYTGDDWAWGSTIGLERLRIFFDNYNGRYLGNLLVLVLTRSKLLDAVVMAASYTLICFFCYGYSADKSKALLWFAAILFFMMPKDILSQAIVWTAGYSNYVPSAMVSGAFLLAARNMTGSELADGPGKTAESLWFFLLGFCGALFVENVTVFHICFAAGIILYVFLRFGRYYYTHFAFLAGAISGACVMFSNSVYREIVEGDDNYRHIPHSIYGLIDYVIEHAKVILTYVIYDNLTVCAITTVLLVLLAFSRKRTETGKKNPGKVVLAFHLISFLLICCKDRVLGALWQTFAYSSVTGFWLEVIVALLYVLSILLMVLCYVEKERRFRMMLPLFCVAGSLAPLVVVDPLGPRCVFVGYFLMMVFVADLAGYVGTKMSLGEKWSCRFASLIVLLQAVRLATIFYPIYQYETLRLEVVKSQAAQGLKTVAICDLPNTDYLWNSVPDKDNLSERYKLFHGLDQELEFEIVSCEELKNLSEAYK